MPRKRGFDNNLTSVNDLNVQRISPQESLSHQIARQLEDSIAQGRLEVGARLPTETRLCDMFGVSRTAVREAIALLRSAGLVETQRGVGTRVTSQQVRPALPARRIRATTAEDIRLVLELRLSLEPRAAALAAERRGPDDIEALYRSHESFADACQRGTQAREEDYRFHRTLVEATHNPCFLNLYEPLHQGAIPRAKLLAGEMDLAAVGDYLGRIIQEHEAVLKAVVAGDADMAFEAMRRHLNRPYTMYASFAAST